MTYVGTYFGMGTGKIMVILFFMLIGLMIALNRRILTLSFIFLLLYIGSLFSKGNGKIYTTLGFFILGLYITKKIRKKLNRFKGKTFLKFLF